MRTFGMIAAVVGLNVVLSAALMAWGMEVATAIPAAGVLVWSSAIVYIGNRKRRTEQDLQLHALIYSMNVGYGGLSLVKLGLNTFIPSLKTAHLGVEFAALMLALVPFLAISTIAHNALFTESERETIRNSRRRRKSGADLAAPKAQS